MRPYGLQPTRLLCPWDSPGQEYWSGLPCPSPGDLPDPGIEPMSLMSTCTGKQVLYHERRVGSIPGLGRSHIPRSDQACAPQLVSLGSRALEPQLPRSCAAATEARAPGACALQQEEPLQGDAWAPRQAVAPLTATRESPCAATRTQCSQN